MSTFHLGANGMAVECWPAGLRDRIAIQCSIRLGRFDRYSWFRQARVSFVRRLARKRSSIRFATPYSFTMDMPFTYTGLVMMLSRGCLFPAKLREIFQATIRPGDCIVDGGSSLGFFSLLAVPLMKGKGRIVAFEPDPETFAFLRQNVENNGFESLIQVERKALTNANGTFEFSLCAEEPMRNSLIPNKELTGERIAISGVRLDDFLAAVGLEKVDVIKLDLEGAEPLALDGMREILKSVRLLVFEVNESQLAELGVDPVKLIAETTRAGSFDEVFFIDESVGNTYNCSSNEFLKALSVCESLNVVCAKKKRDVPQGVL